MPAKAQKYKPVAKKRKKRIVNTDPSMLRINKVLAAAGLGSRRDVEEWVLQGRVEVDREIVKDLAFRVNPSVSTIKVDGEVLKQPRKVYYILNKPPGVLSTNHDPSGRMRVIDLVPDQQRVFSVGRLDRSSEGLILLTNDGELAQRLAHPKYRIQKSYFVVVAGLMTKEELAKLRKGVHLAEGFAKIDGATIRKHRKGCTELEIVLSEGKNREIRRILARAGHKVVLLRRIAIGTLRLGLLPVGASRELTSSEVKALYNVSKPKATKKAGPAKPGTKTAKKPTSKTTKKPNIERAEEEFAFDDDELLANLDNVKFNDLDDASFTDDEFGVGEFPDAYDDDFVGGFDTTPKSGSVIGADDEEARPRPRGNKKASRRNPSGRSGARSSPRPESADRKKPATKRGSAKSSARSTGRGVNSASKSAPAKGGRSGSTTRGGKGTGKGANAKRSATKRNSPRRGAKSSPKGKRR